MKQMNKRISAKIEKVKNEHQELLDIAKSQITENNEAFTNNADEVMAMLNYDEQNIKKYEAIKQAQDLITSLTEQILHAQSVEEITTLRKKINYYINKIKAELKSRNVSEEYLNTYLGNVTSLRKSIALYIRFFKREDNITKINQMSANFDNLSKEELTDFKKCLQKEDRYNKRNIDAFNAANQQEEQSVTPTPETPTPVPATEAEAEDIDPEDVQEEEADEKKPMGLVFDQEDEIEPAPFIGHFAEDSEPIFGSVDSHEPYNFGEFTEGFSECISQDYDIKYISQDTPYEETNAFFSSKASNYNTIFEVVEPIEYSKGNPGRNTIIFFRNIPRYIHNKFAIREMEREFFYYYRGGDFAGYIEFMKKKNSIQEALKAIFEGTCLFSSEDELLNEHEDCAKWMHDFCAREEIPIWVRKRYTYPLPAEN